MLNTDYITRPCNPVHQNPKKASHLTAHPNGDPTGRLPEFPRRRLNPTQTMSTTAAEAASAVPPSVVSTAEETLAAAESVGDHLSQLLAAAADDPDSVAELPPLRRARAFLALAHAATSLFAGTFTLSPYRCISIKFFFYV